MAAIPPVEVTEQRTASLTAARYRELENSPAVRELIEAGVVAMVRSKSTPFGIRAGPYVGQALVAENLRLVIREKVEGALQNLLNWSIPADLREVAVPSAVAHAHHGPVLEGFARRLLQHLAEYLRYGRLKEYRVVGMETAVPRGRIDVVRTARLRARGNVGQVAVRRPDLTADVLANRLLALAISSLEAYFRLEHRCADIVEQARFYAPLFEDVDRLHLERRDWESRSDAFKEALDDLRVGGELRNALVYARAVVLNLGPWLEEEWDQGPPSSFFLNLQTLFEDAVRQVMLEAALDPVFKGRELRHPLFEDLAGRYIVDPDIVIGEPPSVSLVVDCKYKDLEEDLPGHDDVYQLAAHAAALGCGYAILIYPGPQTDVKSLGTTNTGVEIRWATVSVNELKSGILQVLEECGVAVNTERAAA